MFTGLIQACVRVALHQPDGNGGSELAVVRPENFDRIDLGESIAVNGACLTVVTHDEAQLRFQMGAATLTRTTMGTLRPGQLVNLERALAFGDRLGGHLVSGHVDTIGTVRERITEGDWTYFTFEYPPADFGLMVDQGSITVNGISLTIVSANAGQFRVMIIPHTLAQTNLSDCHVGDPVNLEYDMLAKHVRQLLRAGTGTFTPNTLSAVERP
ncbi:MAG: riboflavin synthase [Gemmataceae bacterium]